MLSAARHRISQKLGNHLVAAIPWLLYCELIHERWSNRVVDHKEGALMARIINFYIPSSYQRTKKETPLTERGKLIIFTRIPRRKSA